jgi:hypothetical protein
LINAIPDARLPAMLYEIQCHNPPREDRSNGCASGDSLAPGLLITDRFQDREVPSRYTTWRSFGWGATHA